MTATSTVHEIKRQLDVLGLDPRGLRFVAWDGLTLKVSRGERGVLIHYNEGTDLYDLEQYDGLARSPLPEGVYADNLVVAIQGAL